MTIKQKFLKAVYPLFQAVNKIFNRFGKKFYSDKPAVQSFYGLSATLTNGRELNFADLRNKKVLIVNTASDCGYTAQFKELEELYEMKKDSLEILAFPANDFKQEKRDDHAIDEFCRQHYGVTFPVMRKSHVGIHSSQNTVFEWLTDKDRNGWNEHAPSWNFCKYLVNEKGNLVSVFESSESPLGKNMMTAVEG